MPDMGLLTDADVDALVQTMIERHCEWLNRHSEGGDARLGLADDEEAWKYDPTQFHALTNEYGYRRVLATTLVGDSCLVIHCEISDGDEGGPSVLTGFHDEETEAFYHDVRLNSIVAGPECDWTIPQRYVYDHTEHVGWRLSDLMLEFDTQRSHTLANGVLINCPADTTDAADSLAPGGTGDGDLVRGS